jgi:hypothetical protein
MHYVTRKSHRMEKHRFSVIFSGALIVEYIPVQHELEKYCFDVSCPRRTGVHHMTRRSHRMQKHKFGLTYM